MLATLASYVKPGLIMALYTHCLNTTQHQKPLPKLAVARRERNDRETQERNTNQNQPDYIFQRKQKHLGVFTELAFTRHYHRVYIVTSTASSQTQSL